MNDDTKYVLAWLVPSIILILGGLFIAIGFFYKINVTFVENGYHQEQMIGSYGIIWKK
jgi:hypothetical protein